VERAVGANRAVGVRRGWDPATAMRRNSDFFVIFWLSSEFLGKEGNLGSKKKGLLINLVIFLLAPQLVTILCF
jgi:hypothetical protein